MTDYDHELEGVPEGLLWLRLFEYADEMARELEMTPTAWMHTQVDRWAQARRDDARTRLTVHQGGGPPTRPSKRRVHPEEGSA